MVPGARLPQRGVQHPAAECPDLARLLRERNEVIGRDQPALGMPPADERLDAQHAAGRQLGFGLIEQLQLIVLDRGAQLGRQGQPAGTVLVLLGRIHAELILSPLGDVHGHVGALQERTRVGPVVGKDRYANARANFDGMAVDHEWLLERREQLPRRVLCFVHVRSRQQDRKFIAAQTRRGFRPAQHAPQPPTELAQKQVAEVVTERVVDLFEAVEVHHQQCERCLVAPRRQDCLAQTVVQQQPIGQAGERVVDRLMLERSLSLLAFGDIAHADHKPVCLLAHLTDRHFDGKRGAISTPAGGFLWFGAELRLRQ